MYALQFSLKNNSVVSNAHSSSSKEIILVEGEAYNAILRMSGGTRLLERRVLVSHLCLISLSSNYWPCNCGFISLSLLYGSADSVVDILI